MTTETAQGWLRTAAFHLLDKRQLLAEAQANKAFPPEGIECAKNIVVMCDILMLKAIEKYLMGLGK